MTGWWIMGSLGEASFFAACFLVGVICLGTIVTWLKVGYGFWLAIGVSLALIILGAVGFWYRVLKVATSDEHREAISRSGLIPRPKTRAKNEPPPMIPSLDPFTDSPGAKLAYRLPSPSQELMAFVAVGVFAMAWNAMLAIFYVFALQGFIRGTPQITLMILLIPATYVGLRTTRSFFESYVRVLGIGSTTVEIEDLPLVPGRTYQIVLVQYGRLVIKKLTARLVCEEESTYHFGTDIRTERSVVREQLILDQGRTRIDWGRPLELDGWITIPADAMHSFQSLHNAVHWKIIVEGEANRWPSYSRSFPVVVYPHAPTRSPGPAS